MIRTLIRMISKHWNGEEVTGLVELAEKKGYKQLELAGIIGVKPQTLSEWKSDKRRSEMSIIARHAMSWVEHVLHGLPDKLMPEPRLPKPSKPTAVSAKVTSKTRTKK